MKAERDLSRRNLLFGGIKGGAGMAALLLVGCDNEDTRKVILRPDSVDAPHPVRNEFTGTPTINPAVVAPHSVETAIPDKKGETETSPAKPTAVTTPSADPPIPDKKSELDTGLVSPSPTPTEVKPKQAQSVVQQPTPQLVEASTPVATPEAKVDLIRFNFGEDVPENLRLEIRKGVNIGVAWLAAKSGVNLEGLSVFAYGSPDRVTEAYFNRKGGDPRTLDQIRRDLAQMTAFAGSRKDFYLLTTSPGWTSASPIVGGPVIEGRYHTIFHELTHVMQYEVKGYNNPPIGWLNEGGAHYFAAKALDENGIYSYKEIKRRHLMLAGSFRDPLQSLENQAALANVDNYSLSFLAMDFLTLDLLDRGVSAVVRYWREIGIGKGAEAAFINAFGKTRSEFYAEFEAYKARGFQ